MTMTMLTFPARSPNKESWRSGRVSRQGWSSVYRTGTSRLCTTVISISPQALPTIKEKIEYQKGSFVYN